MVHSVIYYRMGDNLIEDDQWSKWALELEELQAKYPQIAAECPLAEAFKGFDHSTGQSLPLEDPWAVSKAAYLLNMKGGASHSSRG